MTPRNDNLHVPDGGYGWVICFAAFLLQALTIGITYTFGIVFVDLLAYFDSTQSETAWIGSIQPALLYFTGIIAAPLLSRIGWRSMAIMGSLISAVGFGTSALVPNIYLLYLTYGVMTGIGNGFMYVTSMVAVQHYFSKRRAMATGIAVSGSGVGTLIFGIVSQLLLDNLGWRLTFLVDSAITLVIGISAGFLFRPLPQVLSGTSDKEPLVNSYDGESSQYDGTVSHDHSKSYGSFSSAQKHIKQTSFSMSNEHKAPSLVSSSSYDRSLQQQHLSIGTSTPTKSNKSKETIKAPVSPIKEQSVDSSVEIQSAAAAHRRQRTGCCSNCCNCNHGMQCHCVSILEEIFELSLFANPVFAIFSISVLIFAFGYHIPYTYTPERAIMLGIAPSKASSLISIMGISNVGFRLALGWIADKSANLRFYFAGIVLVMMGSLGLMVTLFNTYPLLVVYSVLFGAFSGSFASLFPVIVVDLLGLHVVEKAMGQVLAVSSVAFLVASPLSGFIIEKTGNINLPFMMVGALGCLGGIFYFFIRCFLPRYGYQGEMIAENRAAAIRKRRSSRLISESFS